MSTSSAVIRWTWAKLKEHKSFTIGEKVVFVALADEADDDGVFYISHRALAEKCGVARDFARRCCRLYRSKGLVEVYAWERDDRSTSANGYRLAIELPPSKDQKYIIGRFTDPKAGNRRIGHFAGVMDAKGGVCIDPLPGPQRPPLWTERTPSVYSGDPLPGPVGPQPGTTETDGGVDRGDRTCPAPIPAQIGNPLLKEGSISSRQRGNLVADLSDYFRDIQNLLPSLPSVKVRALDKRFVADLFRRGVPLEVVEAACWLSVARAQTAPNVFTAIKSFRYFLPVIEEILTSPQKAAMLRQSAFYRVKLLGAAATLEDRANLEAMLAPKSARASRPAARQPLTSVGGASGKGEKHSAHPKRVSNERKKKK